MKKLFFVFVLLFNFAFCVDNNQSANNVNNVNKKDYEKAIDNYLADLYTGLVKTKDPVTKAVSKAIIKRFAGAYAFHKCFYVDFIYIDMYNTIHSSIYGQGGKNLTAAGYGTIQGFDEALKLRGFSLKQTIKNERGESKEVHVNQILFKLPEFYKYVIEQSKNDPMLIYNVNIFLLQSYVKKITLTKEVKKEFSKKFYINIIKGVDLPIFEQQLKKENIAKAIRYITSLNKDQFSMLVKFEVFVIEHNILPTQKKILKCIEENKCTNAQSLLKALKYLEYNKYGSKLYNNLYPEYILKNYLYLKGKNGKYIKNLQSFLYYLTENNFEKAVKIIKDNNKYYFGKDLIGCNFLDAELIRILSIISIKDIQIDKLKTNKNAYTKAFTFIFNYSSEFIDIFTDYYILVNLY